VGSDEENSWGAGEDVVTFRIDMSEVFFSFKVTATMEVSSLRG